MRIFLHEHKVILKHREYGSMLKIKTERLQKENVVIMNISLIT